MLPQEMQSRRLKSRNTEHETLQETRHNMGDCGRLISNMAIGSQPTMDLWKRPWVARPPPHPPPPPPAWHNFYIHPERPPLSNPGHPCRSHATNLIDWLSLVFCHYELPDTPSSADCPPVHRQPFIVFPLPDGPEDRNRLSGFHLGATLLPHGQLSEEHLLNLPAHYHPHPHAHKG